MFFKMKLKKEKKNLYKKLKISEIHDGEHIVVVIFKPKDENEIKLIKKGEKKQSDSIEKIVYVYYRDFEFSSASLYIKEVEGLQNFNRYINIPTEMEFADDIYRRLIK